MFRSFGPFWIHNFRSILGSVLRGQNDGPRGGAKRVQNLSNCILSEPNTLLFEDRIENRVLVVGATGRVQTEAGVLRNSKGIGGGRI